MRNILILATVFLLMLANINAEIVTPGSIISIKGESDLTSSLDIKDTVRANLIRPYGSENFQVDASKLPSLNDDKYLLTYVSDKPIVVTPNKLEVGGKGIEFINGNAFLMPLTKYELAKNLRISGLDSGDVLKVQDSKLSFNTNRVLVKGGIVYAGENEIPLKIMPNMILNDLVLIFKEENFKGLAIFLNEDKIEYTYTFNRPAKLFYLFNMNTDVSIVVDAKTGDYKIKKPFWTIFASGETEGVKEYNFTQYAAF